MLECPSDSAQLSSPADLMQKERHCIIAKMVVDLN